MEAAGELVVFGDVGVVLVDEVVDLGDEAVVSVDVAGAEVVGHLLFEGLDLLFE